MANNFSKQRAGLDLSLEDDRALFRTRVAVHFSMVKFSVLRKLAAPAKVITRHDAVRVIADRAISGE